MGERGQYPSEGIRSDTKTDAPSQAEVQAQIERIISSPEMRRASRLADFLTYIVEETLEGRQDRIKAYAIGIEVFGRDTSFDPQFDPVVRIEAGRLRREIEYYYLTSGRDDPVAIEIPKGGYVPHFFYRAHVSPSVNAAPQDAPPGRSWLPAFTRREWWQRHWRWAGTGAFIACLFGLVAVGTSIERSKSAPPSEIVAQPTILVQPFADLDADRDMGLRAAAISEELKARLARFREITVIVPTTAADSARSSTAYYVLGGSVRADATRLRLTARLTDRMSGAVLWSDVYDIDVHATNAIAIEEDIATRIADAVAQPYGVLFRGSLLAGTNTPAVAISDSYRCALDFYRYRSDLGAQLHANVRDCLQRSVAENPNDATAWAMLSYTYLDEDRFGYNRISSPLATDRALSAAQRAVQLDPANVRGLQALMTALFFNREPEEALRIGEQAYRLNPDDTELLGEYGSRLMQVGQRKRGMAIMEEAIARNPGNTGLYAGQLALGVYLDGDEKRALLLIRRSDLQRFAIYHFVAALIFTRNGMQPEADRSRETFLKMRPDFFAHFGAELDNRNFNTEDRTKLIAGAREAGFPVPPEVPGSNSRAPLARSY